MLRSSLFLPYLPKRLCFWNIIFVQIYLFKHIYIPVQNQLLVVVRLLIKLNNIDTIIIRIILNLYLSKFQARSDGYQLPRRLNGVQLPRCLHNDRSTTSEAPRSKLGFSIFHKNQNSYVRFFLKKIFLIKNRNSKIQF